jgi:hypothetical protein
MCIRLIIAPLDKRASHLGSSEIAAASGLLAERGAVSLSAQGECPCGFASGDRATGNNWAVRQDLKASVIAAVRYAADQMKRFRLTASWMDDPVATEQTVTVDELIHTISSGVIARRSFVVRAA